MLRFIFPIEFEANIYALSRLVRRKKTEPFKLKHKKVAHWIYHIWTEMAERDEHIDYVMLIEANKINNTPC